MKVSEVLKGAKDLLTPEMWGQDESVSTIWRSPKICAATAITQVAWNALHDAGESVWKAARQTLGDAVAEIGPLVGPSESDISVWNDSHTYAEVIEGFDKAIQLALEREA